MVLLYEYNRDWTFKCNKLVDTLDDVLIKSIQESQTIDGEEILIETPLENPVFPQGITDIKPPQDMAVYPNISPKFIDGEWIEDSEAVKAHLESLPKTKQLMSHEQMDELLTYLAGGKM